MIVIGDSHTHMFDNQCDIYHINAPTAYNIKKHDKIIQSVLQNINLFIFGEIDCRIHIYYQHKKQKIKIPILIYNTIQNYLFYVQELIDKKHNIIILGITPSGTQDNYFNYEYYASYPIRKFIYYLFNKQLKHHCHIQNIPFIDYFNDICDFKMDRLNEYIKDDVHLNVNAGRLILKKGGLL